jgi:hypothetical protein
MNNNGPFFVGEIVEIFYSENGNKKWYGLKAEVMPWPEHEEQFVDGLIHNWLKPLTKRPDEYEFSEFMWPMQNLKRVNNE